MARKRTKSYPGSITKRGAATWRVRLHAADGYHSYTVHGTRLAAQNFATTKHAELKKDHGRLKAGLPGPVRFSQLIEEFKRYELPTLSPGSQEVYDSSFKAFAPYFVAQLGDPLVRDIRRSHVATFLEWRRTYRGKNRDGKTSLGGVSLHTVARDRRVLHRVFNYAILKDHLEANPCAMVRAPKGDPRNPPILTETQLDDFLKAAAPNPMLRTFILVLADSGVRSESEALQLEWEDIDLQAGFLRLRSEAGRRTKSGKVRSVPLTARLKTALQEHAARYRLAMYKGVRSPYLFHHLTGRGSCVAGGHIRSIRASFNAAKKTAKLPAAFRPHDLRHRRVTTWLAAGANPVHVKEAMGHASLSTTMGYTHLLPEHLRALVEEPAGALMQKAKGG